LRPGLRLAVTFLILHINKLCAMTHNL
jgi:hypothetical protein